MSSGLRATIVLMGLALAAPSAALEPERAGQEAFVIRAVFAQGRLWVLSDAGVLSSLAEGETAWRREDAGGPVLDLCRAGDAPMVLTHAGRNEDGAFTILARTGMMWTARASVPGSDATLAMACEPRRTTLLLWRHLVTIDDRGHSTSVPIVWPLGRARVTSIAADGDGVLVGLNGGEWGGGLRRVDRKSGAVTEIFKDDVNAIVREPWQPGCVAVAIGMVHFEPSGEIAEVCGDRRRRFYRKRLKGKPDDPSPFDTEAFFAMTRIGDGLAAVGLTGIYGFEAEGLKAFEPLPAFETIGGIGVSFVSPHIVLVRTEVGQRNSVGGATPLLVPR